MAMRDRFLRRLSGVAGLLLFVSLPADGVAPVSPPPAVVRLEPRIDEVTFESSALGRERSFVVVHPTGEGGPAAQRPVLVLLHGRGRHRHSLLELPDARAALLGADLWVILPEGGNNWYLNSPVAPSDRYSDHLLEVIRVASDHFGLRTDPAGRAIAGWSMGGYGAVRFAQEHADMFGSVVAIIGLLDFPRPETLPPGRNYSVPVARFGADPARWPALNPLNAVAGLRGKSILLITAEDAFDRVMNENFSRALIAADIAHDYRLLPGAHTLDVVRTSLPLMISFVQQSTLASPR